MLKSNHQFYQYFAINQFPNNYNQFINNTSPKNHHQNNINHRRKSISQQTIINHNNPSQKLTHNIISRQYFVNVLDFYHHHHRDISKKTFSNNNKIISNRSSKSPFRKIFKSKSFQSFHDPVQRVLNVIQQQKKARQERKLNEQTLRQLHFIPTFSELNDTFLNFSKIIKEAKSQRNICRVKYLKNEELNIKYGQKKSKQQQEKKKNFLKKSKSIDEKNLSKKISPQKVKCYFIRKQERQSNRQKIKEFLEIMSENQNIKLKEIELQQFSYSDFYKWLDSKDVPKNVNYENKNSDVEYFSSDFSYSGESSNSSNSSSLVHYEQSDYGFNIADIGPKRSLARNPFSKTPKRVNDQLSLNSKSMKMSNLSKSQQKNSQSQSINSCQNSILSIQSISKNRKSSLLNSSCLQPKKFIHLGTENVLQLQSQSQSSNYDYQTNSNLNKLKNDKLKSSGFSKMSQNQIEIDSKIGKRTSNFIKDEKIQNSNNSMMGLEEDSELSLNSKRSMKNEKMSDQMRKQEKKVDQPSREKRDIQCIIGPQIAVVKREQKPKVIRFIKVNKKVS